MAQPIEEVYQSAGFCLLGRLSDGELKQESNAQGGLDEIVCSNSGERTISESKLCVAFMDC